MSRGKNYFPFIVKLEGKKILFIGGGKVAEGKILRLLSIADSVDVTVCSKNVTKVLQKLYEDGIIKFISMELLEVEKNLFKDFDFVIAATNNKRLNAKIAEVVIEIGKFALDVSDSKNSNFFFPAVLSYDDLLIAISSFGKEKKRVKNIRERLEEFFGTNTI
ncbi:MAG: bifunctional precorrin-2 dehydrogenase/sirohydrochlorin ferrochelatase [Calditerrivibrio sp.]|nr:bifunctional precorrin-2 dehydrogenase/sirohydrochlorin ferrochelatase [Calditerrivibrio sp.]MCA1932717.1 bifunctional precorrin-2 dehydrogenase/sirohydrochlorin ferrochelatase [Calditerrivibrio sp.]